MSNLKSNKKKINPNRKGKGSNRGFPIPIRKMQAKSRMVGNGFLNYGKNCPRITVLVSKNYSVITRSQLDSARKTIRKKLNKVGKLFLRVWPSISITAKPLQVRMGKGKGRIVDAVVVLKPGKVIFEIRGVIRSYALMALRSGACKLPVETEAKYFL